MSYTLIILLLVLNGLIIAFLYLKEKDLVTSLTGIESSIDELQNSNPSASTTENTQGIDDSKYVELDTKIYELGESLIKIVRTMKSLDIEHKELDAKVKTIENQLKLTLLSSGSSNQNEKDIIQMYKSGMSSEEISKEKRVPIGEVELIIKLASLQSS